jgi:hypothetical protein
MEHFRLFFYKLKWSPSDGGPIHYLIPNAFEESNTTTNFSFQTNKHAHVLAKF